MQFEELSLDSKLLNGIKSKGYEKLTPIQSIVIPKALEGFDILGGAPTGTGKSAAFLIPVIQRIVTDCLEKKGCFAVILEPTRELATQTCAVCSELLVDYPEIKVNTIIGGESRDKQKEEAAIVVATPGRFNEFLKKDWFDSRSVEILVIDEADRMLDLGFKDEVAKITRSLTNRYQTMLFSATLDGAGIKEFADEVLNDPIEVRLGAGDNEDEKLPELMKCRAYYAANPEQKIKILLHLLTTTNAKSIVFARTKDRAQELYAKLRRNGFNVAILQGDLSQSERRKSLEIFAKDKVQILVATDVASRGLDLPYVAYVYNYDLPGNGRVFIHRAGRTARAGEKGVVVSLVEANELALKQRLERYILRDFEQRQIKGLCAAFPILSEDKKLPTKKDTRASLGGKGGFDKRKKEEDKKPRKKIRHRDIKNKGKPDFAKKKANRELRALNREKE